MFTSKPDKNEESEEENISDANCFCIICVEPFFKSKPSEQWIQCRKCKRWAHERYCKNLGQLFYVCRNCDNDKDDDDDDDL